MFSLSRLFLIVAVTSFLTPCFCPGMVMGCKGSFALFAPDCRQNEATPCCKHSCCKYTNRTVVSKNRNIALNSPVLALVPSSETLSVINLDGLLVSRPQIRAFYHPEYSQILRL